MGGPAISKYGHASCHYPVLSIPQLCQLPVKGIAAKPAVLFLWFPAPMLVEVAFVITAWGFKYKTHWVWDKVGHNFGHYLSVRHENFVRVHPRELQARCA